MSTYSDSFHYTGAFVLTEESLKHLFKALSNFSKNNVEIALSFPSGHKISAHKIQDILSDSLLKASCVSSISLVAGNYKTTPSKRASISIGNPLSPAITVEISGSKSDCLKLRHEIDNQVKETEELYGWLYKAKEPLSFAFWIGGALLIVGLYKILQPLFDLKDWGWLFLLLGAFIGFYIESTAHYFFPQVSYNFGYGKVFLSRLRNLRGALIAFILVTIGGGLLVNYLTPLLPNIQTNAKLSHGQRSE